MGNLFFLNRLYMHKLYTSCDELLQISAIWFKAKRKKQHTFFCEITPPIIYILTTA